MTAWLAAAGWSVALCALAALAVQQASMRRRLALVAQAAHELRGPLSAALLGLHGVVAEGTGARRMAAVELELRRAGLALADLEVAPRGRSAPECIEVVDVRVLLAEAAYGWRPLARAHGIELVVDPGGARLLVHADRLRLVQAVGNLVVNALQHGAGPVRVRAQATRAHVRIEVHDRGPGLPAPLATAGPHTGRRGHGLVIAARIAARHGGRLSTAPAGAGSCVVLELPRLDGAQQPPRDEDARRPRRRRRRLQLHGEA